MRCADLAPWVAAVVLLPSWAAPRSESLVAVHRQRYSMGTMFDIVVYHRARAEAERAVTDALEEVLRLEAIMSHFRADSDLTKLNRRAAVESVTVDPSLHDVIRQSLAMSRRSGGRFDITIGPLMRTWKRAAARGSRPSAEEIAQARRCVGYRNIEMQDRDRIRFRSGCIELDLGGIGKGYAVDRALAILRSAGIRHAMINAGGSSIAATGAPPNRKGWPVLLGQRILLLTDRSMSTSRQDPASAYGDIIDPLQGVPAGSRTSVSVVATSATVADALSTTLVMLSVEEGRRLVGQFPDVSVLWISPAGQVRAGFRDSRLDLIRAH